MVEQPIESPEQPWEELEKLVERADGARAQAFLETLDAGEAARALSRLSDEDQTRLLETLDPTAAADLVQDIPDAQAAEIIERLDPETAAAIVQEMPSDELADLIGDLEHDDAEAILAELAPEEAEEARELSRYDDDVAGGLMVTEYFAYRARQTVAQVVADMRDHAEHYRHYEIQYAYVVDAEERLIGVLRLRDLLLAEGERPIGELMIGEPLSVRDDADLETLEDFFDEHSLLGVPVVNGQGVLLGVVRRSALEEALLERSESDYRRSQGIIAEELRTMPLWLRARRRLAWLSLNIVLNILAASVIAFYQDTLSAVIALAVFLPIISDMSGCSGSQAIAVSMRELTLGLIRPSDVLRVWLKEASVGLVNGLALGLLIAATAWVWKGNPWLGLVVGAAMMGNTLVAVSIGGVVPLALKRLKMDPALASGPILTTITDMCGFFLILSLASAMLAKLTA